MTSHLSNIPFSMFIVPCTNYTAEVLRSHPWGETLRGPSSRRRRRGCFLTLTAMSLPMTSLLMEYNDLVFVARVYFLYIIFWFLYYGFLFSLRARMCSEYVARIHITRDAREKMRKKNRRKR